jgi:Mn2+/Fe2+ NRAMP family transporter
VFANVVSMCIIVATGAAIGGSGRLGSASQAARALEPVVGHAAETLFAIGLLGASALAAAVVPLSTSYAIAEAVGAERSVSRRMGEAKLFVGLFTAQVALGAAFALLPGNLITLLLDMQVLNGLITPVLLAFIVVLAGRRRVLGEYANGRWYHRLAATIVVLVGALALVVAVQSL